MIVRDYLDVVSRWGQTSFSDATGLNYATWFYNQEIPQFLMDYEISRMSAELGVNAPSIHIFLDATGTELNAKHKQYNELRGVK